MLGTAVGPIFLEVFSLDFVFAIIYACLHAEKKVVWDFAARHKYERVVQRAFMFVNL